VTGDYIPGFLKLVMQRPENKETHKHTYTEAGTHTMQLITTLQARVLQWLIITG